jgi:hypothetical protein
MFNMKQINDDVRLDASQYAKAITRWENDGGAPEHGTRKTGAERKVKPASDVVNIQGASDANGAARTKFVAGMGGSCATQMRARSFRSLR